MRLASAAVVLAAAALALAVSIQAQAANVTDTFKPTGGAQSWTVPAGVTSVTFDVFGAAGEEAAGQVAGSAPTPGGTGAHVQATLAVTPGETLEIVVGDQDGFNGGGAAGGFGLNGAGRGGGTSDVRAGACAASLACDLSSRVLVAGAGGGAGGLSISGSNRSATFGGVGGSAGSAGKDGSSFLGSGGTGGGGGAGGAGGASNGGSAGAGGTTSGGARPVAGSPGTAGMLGQGGAGGTSRITATGGGGGGGGGYYGGGSGGAVATNSGGAEGGGGGGGGGSSFVGPGAVGGVVAGNTGADGDGLVQITYTAQDVSIAIAGRNGLLGRGVISVAVFSTSDVDARTVDPGTVCFGDAEDPTQRDCTERDGKSNVLDMNHDRQPDVLLQFDTQESGIDPGDTQACLTGRTFDNRPIAGCASIVGIPTLLPLLGFPVFS